METVINPKRKRRSMKKIGFWTLGIILGLLVLISIFGSVYLNRLLPQIEGDLKLSLLEKPVNVVRDNEGVPHIEAQNEHDLFIAQGYVQAQDRLFQMDLSRRQASGRLSEVIGDATLNNDKYFRTLGLRRAAEASYVKYSSDAQQVLNWFAEGVNVYIKQLEENGKWPVEFTILGYTPEKWSAVDSLTIGKYMAFDLGGKWKNQAFRYYLLQQFPEDKAYELFPSYPKEAPTVISDDELDLATGFSEAIFSSDFKGSNNWVLSGEKSASGSPLLANDPHLSLATPSIWYQSHLKAPTVNVSGVIFAGIPGIILGHNESIAWGVTNTGPDVQDLYIEKKNPKGEFLYNEKWEKPEVIKEPIKVKDKKSVDYAVTVTRHGPIITDFLGKENSEMELALKWTALDPSNELEAILRMNKAANWNEFETALEDFHVPAQNFVFASMDGTIAYKANGKIPIRKKGDGLFPVPGWTDEYEWEGYIPFDELPKVINPEKGFISTANNKIVSEEYPYHISNDWAQPYRQMRIMRVLNSKEKFTIKDMKNLQMDKYNLQAEEFVPMFLANLPATLTDQEKEAVALLEKWDFDDNKEKGAPLLFQLWIAAISDVLFTDQISDEMIGLFGDRKQAIDQLLREASIEKPGIWVTEQGGLSNLLHTSLKKAIKDGVELQGERMVNWKWGQSHKVIFKHPLSSVKPLNYLFNFNKAIPTGGSSVTVQAAGYNDEQIVDEGGSWRFVIDLDNINEAYHLVGPGQSGQVFSNWYHNQMKDWENGTYHKTTLNAKGDILQLLP